MFRLKLLLLACIVLFSSLNAQSVISTCGHEIHENTPSLQKTEGSALPLSGTLKILVVYCKFKDDNFDQPPNTDLWPSSMQSLPSWTQKTISREIMPVYPEPSISSYFSLMSSGKLNVIGNVCPVLYVPKYEESYYYSQNGKNLSFLASEIIKGIDPHVNYSDYDSNKDGVADMIAVCFRTVKDFGKLDPRWGRYQGTASLTGSYTKFNYSDVYPQGSSSEIILDGVKIRPGFGGSGTIQNNIYDPDGQLPVILHEIGHYFFGYGFNGSVHLSGTHHHGLMDTNLGGGIMNAYERDLLGWISPRIISGDRMNVVLKDAVTASDVIKIRTALGSYYFENFQGNDYYQKSWKYYNGGPLMTPGSGLRISRINNSGSSRLIDIKTAGGKWKWKSRDGKYLFPFEHDRPDSKSGLDELQLVSVSTTSGIKNHPDYMGMEKDFFAVGYNQVFSQWSNPAVESDLNFAVELVSGEKSDLTLNFYFSDPLKAPPAKPQDIKIAADQAGKFIISWPSDTEPDVLSGGSYRIYRASSASADPATFNLISTVNHKAGADIQSFEDPLSGPGNSPPDQTASVRTISYRVSAVDRSGMESAKSESISIIDSGLTRNTSGIDGNSEQKSRPLELYPNPFNSAARISFVLSMQEQVCLELYDILGKKVMTVINETRSAGTYNEPLDASGLPAGIYILRLSTGRFTHSIKIMHLK